MPQFKSAFRKVLHSDTTVIVVFTMSMVWNVFAIWYVATHPL